MTDWTQAHEGGCRCGALRFRLTGAPMLTSACHCTGCQKMTGGAFSLTLTMPAADHYHCDRCKSWVFTRAEGIDWFVNVRTTMLDAPDDAPPFLETWTDEKLPWVETGAAKRYPGDPDWSDWDRLTGEYAARA